ncbi:MAG TPA: hypothetical protein VGX23_02690 [Actinocrinis sp.]|nr:hypothetical protein [Actinocrinis sp.]
MRDVRHFVNELLPNREVGGPARPVPVVVLLGPNGSGKSGALDAISAACAETVVHARFDFQRGRNPSTIEVLTDLADTLSRGWRHRPRVRFRRLTLGLLAVQADLSGLDRAEARTRIRAIVNAATHAPTATRAADLVSTFTDLAETAGVLPDPVIKAVKAALPGLITALAAGPWRAPRRWIAQQPAAEGADTVDSLLRLNRLAREEPGRLTSELADAFLADVRDDLPRLARREEGAACHCTGTHGRRHWHNWVILLDDVDHPAGAAFLRDLLQARERSLGRRPGDWDQLLLIGTSRTWRHTWEPAWQPVWAQAPPGPRGPAKHPVLPVRDTHRAAWRYAGKADGPHAYLPATLRPMAAAEVAAALGTLDSDPRRVFVSRATGGLYQAVEYARHNIHRLSTAPGSRDPFGALDPHLPSAEFWQRRMLEMGLADLNPRIAFEDFIAAAAFATAPWLISAETVRRVGQLGIGQILTALRGALWVIAGPQDGATLQYAQMNPWISRGLQYALADRGKTAPATGPGASGGAGTHPGRYQQSFELLLADPDTAADETRVAYCRLALGQVHESSDYLIRTFDEVPHEAWVDRLALVASAPDNLSLDRTVRELYHELGDSRTRPARAGAQSRTANTIRRLLVAGWLAGNTLAVPDAELFSQMADSYRLLAAMSQQGDVAALYRAADAAANPLP